LEFGFGAGPQGDGAEPGGDAGQFRGKIRDGHSSAVPGGRFSRGKGRKGKPSARFELRLEARFAIGNSGTKRILVSFFYFFRTAMRTIVLKKFGISWISKGI
jgi:hypothetical protein